MESLCKPVKGGQEVVRKLLDKAHSQYDIIYEGYLANHLPHAMYTILALGAPVERLQEYYNIYVKKLEPRRKELVLQLDTKNWKGHIGDKKIYSEFVTFFDTELTQHGLKPTFDLYFSPLMPLTLGAAFHPLIHIGYAMEFQSQPVLSEGFAYACTYPLKFAESTLDSLDFLDMEKPQGESTETSSVLELLETLRCSKEIPKLSNDIGNFHYKTEYLLEHHRDYFRTLMARWGWDMRYDDETQLLRKLNELTEASILGVYGSYKDKIDFFLVHGITANHGVRVIFPHLTLERRKTLLIANLLGLLTAYVVQGCPEIRVEWATDYKRVEREDETLDWEEIIQKVISVEEEHIPKLVRSLIHYLDMGQEAQRSKIFTEQFLKRCAFKTVDVLKDINDYVF